VTSRHNRPRAPGARRAAPVLEAGAGRRAEVALDGADLHDRGRAVPRLGGCYPVSTVLDRASVAAFVAELLDTGSAPATARARYRSLRLFSAARWAEPLPIHRRAIAGR
jgi:hypothetical protein